MKVFAISKSCYCLSLVPVIGLNSEYGELDDGGFDCVAGNCYKVDDKAEKRDDWGHVILETIIFVELKKSHILP